MNSREDWTAPSKFRGWLLDLYPSNPGEMTLWFITKNDRRVKVVDEFRPKIYVCGSSEDLKKLPDKLVGSKSISSIRFVEKYASITDSQKSRVLEIEVSDWRRAPFFARKIVRLGSYGKFRLCNVDIPPSQAYLYERNIFPLAFMEVSQRNGRCQFKLLDSVESRDYEVPQLRILWLDIKVEGNKKIVGFFDKIWSFKLRFDGEETVIDGGSERDKLLKLVRSVKEIDPDIIFTNGGDSFLFPYLARRALINDVLNDFILSRENIPLKAKLRHGITFFSYGRVYYKAPVRRLFGRVHIDENNTFIYSSSGLEGLIEVSRTCRVPLHKAARASIGTIMSSLQLYTAMKSNILIPWKKTEPETFKSAWELLVADRGGFIYEPKVGIHDDVGELDFASMYPMLMYKYNISAETVLCKCCPNSRIRVPELGYHICEKRRGIVPKVLGLILNKRLDYKRMRNEVKDPRLREIYDRRQDALKWILVTCFGYLGYRNARFGKVDAHIAVCALARDTLLRAAHIAEENGFEIIHGIVDSLWLKKEGASSKDFVDISRTISDQTGIPISFEGKYRWIVFLPSIANTAIPVLNRYYGVFENGKLKIRGIEARKRDTPEFIRRAQLEMIGALARAKNSKEFMERIPCAIDVVKKYASALIRRKVPLEQLLITKQLSFGPLEYSHDIFQAIAAKQLLSAGVDISAGQIIRYLITDAENKKPNRRVRAAELIDENTNYDLKKYIELLFSAAANILSPFGYKIETVKDLVLYGDRQAILS